MGDPGVHAKHRLIKDLKKFETKALLNIYFMYRRGGRELSSDTLIPLRLPENFLVIFEALDLVLDQQKDSFLVMCSKLRLNLAVFKRDYYKILDNLFLREPTWPRVLTAAAFTYALGDFCQVNGPEEAWDLLPDHLHQYLGQDVFSAALQRQGGLVSFNFEGVPVLIDVIYLFSFFVIGWFSRILRRFSRKIVSLYPSWEDTAPRRA
jgi:hypothetical protein